MKTDTSMKHHLGVKEPSIKDVNWRALLRRYQNGTISIIDEYKLIFYAEIYGIYLD